MNLHPPFHSPGIRLCWPQSRNEQPVDPHLLIAASNYHKMTLLRTRQLATLTRGVLSASALQVSKHLLVRRLPAVRQPKPGGLLRSSEKEPRSFAQDRALRLGPSSPPGQPGSAMAKP